MWKIILAAAGFGLLLACQADPPADPGDHGHDHATDGEHSHAEAVTVSRTERTDAFELFVEYPSLVVGQVSRFAAHLTTLGDYAPVRDGELTVSLIQGDRGIRQTAEGPSRPGIFTPALQPTRAGMGKLIFEFRGSDRETRIVLDSVQVFASAEAAAAATPPASEPAGTVAFLKEQAWQVDFAVAPVIRQPIRDVIRTAGEIKPVQGEEQVVAAKSSGIVLFGNRRLYIGREVRAGQALFTINTEGLIQGNLSEKIRIASARLERTRADFERAEGLLEQQIIGRQEFEQRQMDYRIAQAEYETLTQATADAGQVARANGSGILKNILVTDGQYVSEGTPLAVIARNRRLLMEARVAQSLLPQLGQIETAHFRTPYQDETQLLADYNGRLISYGKVLETGERFLPVLFELDNVRDLIPGSFVELFLLSRPLTSAVVVPRSALLRDYGGHYVYVQIGGESFVKRDVRLGADDGLQVQITQGLSPGEWVVTQGAYQIKMASMATSIPGHGHEH